MPRALLIAAARVCTVYGRRARPPPTASSRRADSAPGIAGLPSGVPAAATAPEPALPEPSSERMAVPEQLLAHLRHRVCCRGGASLWTDFLYDDHGPLGSPVGIAESTKVSDLAPVHGGFVYPEGPAENNGADIFRAAVGYSHGASYWRVDWNTLADANVPIAEWTFSTASSDARRPAKRGPPTPA